MHVLPFLYFFIGVVKFFSHLISPECNSRFFMEAHVKIWYEGKVSTKIYRALRSGKENWTCGVSVGVAPVFDQDP
jgi:hypothetical protein